MSSAIETQKRRFLLAVFAGAALLGALLLLSASGEAHKGGPDEDDCAVEYRELGDRIGPDPDHPGMDIHEPACVRWRMFEQRESPPQVGFTRKWTRWSDWYDTSIAENDCTGP